MHIAQAAVSGQLRTTTTSISRWNSCCCCCCCTALHASRSHRRVARFPTHFEINYDCDRQRRSWSRQELPTAVRPGYRLRCRHLLSAEPNNALEWLLGVRTRNVGERISGWLHNNQDNYLTEFHEVVVPRFDASTEPVTTAVYCSQYTPSSLCNPRSVRLFYAAASSVKLLIHGMRCVHDT